MHPRNDVVHPGQCKSKVCLAAQVADSSLSETYWHALLTPAGQKGSSCASNKTALPSREHRLLT